jgi:secreted Zn-dependent insulinase-like peptidase
MTITTTQKRFMALSDEEKESLRLQLIDELQQEHNQREERAHRKRDRRQLGTIRQETYRNQEIKQIQSNVRKNFYQRNGYRLEKDPTGRDMWLSPAEQENRKRRQKGRSKKRHKDKATIAKRETLILYASIVGLAVLIGLFISQ